MGLQVNFTSLRGLKMQGGFFPEDKGRPIRATVTEFVYSPQATKERQQAKCADQVSCH